MMNSSAEAVEVEQPHCGSNWRRQQPVEALQTGIAFEHWYSSMHSCNPLVLDCVDGGRPKIGAQLDFVL
jgi:hypothetical protein